MTDVLEQIAQHLNEQGAEITVLRTVLRGLVARVIVADPAYIEETLEQMKTDASDALGRAPMNPQNDSIEEQRVAALVKQQLDLFFRQLEVAVSKMRNSAGQSGRN